MGQKAYESVSKSFSKVSDNASEGSNPSYKLNKQSLEDNKNRRAIANFEMYNKLPKGTSTLE